MAAPVIKDLPPELHEKLNEQARRHHRSMTKEAIVWLDHALTQGSAVRGVPAPHKGRFPLSDALIDKAKREWRS